jgi:membrane-associated protease RseP (regulator of RpoE activity)
VHIFRGAGFVTGVEVASVSEALDASDQVSFHEVGIPAVQLFSGPHLDYHRPSDTFEKIDGDGLRKVAAVTREVIGYLASFEASLTPLRNTGQTSRPVVTKGPRGVSLGTIPDFAFSGEGYRLSGVVPDSPAQHSGLKEGDVITQIGLEKVSSLKDLFEALKSLRPGDETSIFFVRNGEKRDVTVQLIER